MSSICSCEKSPNRSCPSRLDKGTNKNRIINMNPAFAKDLSGMMKELQEKATVSAPTYLRLAAGPRKIEPQLRLRR